MTLGHRIKEFRKNANLSQEKLAEIIGVSRQAVTKWESNQSVPSTEHLFRLAEIFDTTVDMLVVPDEENKQSLAEQIYHIHKIEEEKIITEKLKKRKKNQRVSFAVAMGYLLVFIICRIIEGTSMQYSVIGWLFGTDPRGLYLFGWLIGNGFYLYASVISTGAALLGKYYFSFATVTGAVSGIILGELFGPDPGGAVYGQGHYGWAIWIGIFVLSVIVGIILEKLAKDKLTIHSKKVWIFCIITAFMVAGVIVVIYISAPLYPQPKYTFETYVEFANEMADSPLYILPDEDTLPDTNGIFTVYSESRISDETAGYTISYGADEEFSVSCRYITPMLDERMTDIVGNAEYKDTDMQITEKYISFEMNGCRYDIEFVENNDEMSIIAYDVTCGIIDQSR